MAVGGVVVTAVGAALGGGYGGVLSNRYFGEVKGFSIVKQNEGGERSIVFTNGFLTEREEHCLDWKHGIRGRFDDAELGTSCVGSPSQSARSASTSAVLPDPQRQRCS